LVNNNVTIHSITTKSVVVNNNNVTIHYIATQSEVVSNNNVTSNRINTYKSMRRQYHCKIKRQKDKNGRNTLHRTRKIEQHERH
jgi:hypothetical protein